MFKEKLLSDIEEAFRKEGTLVHTSDYADTAGLIGKVVLLKEHGEERHLGVIVNEGSGGIEEITDIPPIVYIGPAITNNYDPSCAWTDKRKRDLLYTYSSEFYVIKDKPLTFEAIKMAISSEKLADSILADLVSDLEGMLNPSKEVATLLSEDSKKSSVVCIPEGCKAFSDIWGWTPSFGDFPVRIFNEDDAPDADADYIWPKNETEELVFAIEQGMNGRTVGHPGTGKSEWRKNYAALTGRAFLWMNYSKELFVEDVIGKMDIRGGDTVFSYGDLPKYVQRPAVILHDEVSRASPGMFLAVLQYHLIHKGVKIQTTGEVIHPHPGLVIGGADNTVGLGDHSDKFPTANCQDVSTLDRWNTTVLIPYLKEEDAATLIQKKVPSLNKDQCKKLARFANLCQNGFAKGTLPLAFSPRKYLNIASLAVGYKDMARAIRAVYVNALDDESKDIVNKLISQVWK